MICLIRKTPVLLTPEEQVRQALLSHLIKLGFSLSHIGVELRLSSLTQLAGQKLPNRRADIIVFSPKTQLPHILIECKAVPLTKATIRQAVGYNFFVKAPILVLANQNEVQTGQFNGSAWAFQPGLPTPSY